MCEYTYENGKKCRLKSLEGSKYCALHISYDEGERLFGEDIKRIKEEAFLKRLKEGQTYFESVYLYEAKISNFRAEKPIVFKNSRIKTILFDDVTVPGITFYNSYAGRIVVFESKVGTLLVHSSNVFGLNILRVKFSNSMYVRNSSVRYLMINSTEYVGKAEKSEEEYGERKTATGRIELSNLDNVRRIGVNVRYPLMRRILEEHGITPSGSSERSVKATVLAFRNVRFDQSARFKRQVRLSVRHFHGQLVLENLNVFGHAEILGGRIKSPEFVHVTVMGNFIFRRVGFYGDATWNVTVLPHLPLELSVQGFVVVEDCRFSNPRMAEIFYRIARTSWERNGDLERADEYYYKEMVSRRQSRLTARVRGIKKVLLKLEATFEWLFADLTCKYGMDWKRPILIWLAAVNVFFPLLFFLTQSVEGVSGNMGFLDYEYFSVVTATTLGYGDYHPVGVGRIIASVEALFGMFMWAVFLTVFARKYMR
ncbi:two pore domain potassium channel family protein [Thermococcus sp. GR7]|uniref:potassium channel family protein n=1 Tax=unclassified Thermococcus TaxID=2627626 RepID=UPI00143081FC|nr:MULTISPECIES: potassium channel family protein [unclassified Thermococcus]NJE46271.1 two pore domain potassium channel family protein [Thermococcus sp. GR7]NJE79325.1 two pore domain potassium channel family protein [Thermococcus sp. GR4]NJF23850.1 two pore domain potassium channel family protein [Thermococcus sp. GR5]